MRVTLLIFLIIPLISNAQFDFEDKNWEKYTVGFGCGAGGRATELVTEIHVLFALKKFKKIQKKLDSKIPGERFFAAFILVNLKKKKELVLDKLVLNKIEKTKHATDLTPVCGGCRFWLEIPLNKLWNKKQPIYKSAKYWFKHYYKMNYK